MIGIGWLKKEGGVKLGVSLQPKNAVLFPACQIDARKERLKGLPKVQIVAARNKGSIVKERNEFSKKVRGESVGRLG
jgi:hypothetical protein